MARVRSLEGAEAGIVTRVVQWIFRRALGRSLNPYWVEAHAPRTVLSSFLSNTLMTTGRWAIGGELVQLVRLRVAAANGCPF